MTYTEGIILSSGYDEVVFFHHPLLFMDSNVLWGTGLCLYKRIKSRFSRTTIAMITTYDSPAYRKAADE